jgi:pyruvate/2-oxoglutarate dehydrogenase complex dihydrolipoamide acyltransferase (E2) component
MHLKKCSGCARAIVESATACDYCGHRAGDPIAYVPGGDDTRDDDTLALDEIWPRIDAAVPQLEAAPDFSTPLAPEGSTPEVPPPGTLPPDPPRQDVRRGIGRRELATGLAGMVGGGILIMVLLSGRGAAAPEAAATPAPTPTPPRAAAAAAPSPAVSPTASPKWSSNAAGWVGQERRSAAFELPAINKVQVWLRQVQPMLVVRCRSNSAEAFVFTQSAAKMEPQDGNHTVRVRFDSEPEITERWADSEEHDALFAPDGAAFARRLAAARTMQFGFTPHNANPVVASFDVSGLNEHLMTAARQCGWKSR